jgi:hypothetical protein
VADHSSAARTDGATARPAAGLRELGPDQLEIAGPIALTVNGLDEADRERFREELVARAAPLLSDDPAAMSGVAINVTTA